MVLVILYWLCQYFLNMLLFFFYLQFLYICFICWHWYNMIDTICLCFYSIIWTRFVYSTFTVFDLVYRGRCLWVQWFLVYNLCWYFWSLCFHMCSTFVKVGFCFTDIYRIFLRLLISMVSIIFWWLNVSIIYNFTSVTDVYAVHYITLSQNNVYIVLIPLLYIKP